jgi:Na+/citrate or Na+/malate symporter
MTSSANSAPQASRQWPGWLSYRVGILPLPVFLPLLGAVAILTLTHTLSNDVSVMIATLAVGGFLCAWLGGLIPFLRRLGAPAITAAFLPSYLIYRHWLPDNLVDTVTAFTKGTSFIYLYITAIIVGSILGMDRRLLLRGIVKIFVPLLAGSILALLIGSTAGIAIGIPLSKAIPMIIIPVMAGGVGEGAIPLSLGYGEIFHQNSADILSHLLPVVLFANLVAIILAGCLNTLGRRFPRLTGNGELEMDSLNILRQPASLNVALIPLTIDRLLAAVLFGVSLYLLGILSHQLLAIPAPVTMLVLAVLLKVSNLLPSWLDQAAASVGRFFAVAVTYPLLFAVAIAMTPWASVKEALHPDSLILITLVVLALTVAGFFVGRWVRLFPVESALINACHTGAGGTGNVAILTAAERLGLMPFAQIATRIGGAITVTLTLLILRLLTGSH